MYIRRFFGVTVAGALMMIGLVAPARATTGDVVTTVTFSQPCSSGIGVGVAFDGQNLWYSCWRQDPDLFRADPATGQVTASYDIAFQGLGAIAYDATRNAIWAGWGGPNVGKIYLVQLDAAKNVTSSNYVFTVNAVDAQLDLDDGLAYDGTDDTLYVSEDTSTTISHYTTSGQKIGQTNWAGQSCYNSGLAVGGDTMFEASDGCTKIWLANKSNPSGAIGNFNTGAVRDEDLECDPVTFASQGRDVIWSREAYSPQAKAFEIPSGSCGLGGLPPQPPKCTISGTPGNDTIDGSNHSEVICARGGDDLVYDRGGHDLVYGQGGNDTLFGGSGHDVLNGGPGDDVIHSDDGLTNERVNGGDGFDRCVIDSGDNVKNCENIKVV
jgi:Ca2+-binding RTX toxin-like protein